MLHMNIWSNLVNVHSQSFHTFQPNPHTHPAPAQLRFNLVTTGGGGTAEESTSEGAGATAVPQGCSNHAHSDSPHEQSTQWNNMWNNSELLEKFYAMVLPSLIINQFTLEPTSN